VWGLKFNPDATLALGFLAAFTTKNAFFKRIENNAISSIFCQDKTILILIRANTKLS